MIKGLCQRRGKLPSVNGVDNEMLRKVDVQIYVMNSKNDQPCARERNRRTSAYNSGNPREKCPVKYV